MRTTWMTWLVLALALCLACNEDDDDDGDDDTGDDDTGDDDAGDDDTGDDDTGDDDTGPDLISISGTWKNWDGSAVIVGTEICFESGKYQDCDSTDQGGAWAVDAPADTAGMLTSEGGKPAIAPSLMPVHTGTNDISLVIEDASPAHVTAWYGDVGATEDPTLGTVGFQVWHTWGPNTAPAVGATIALAPGKGAGPYYCSEKTLEELDPTLVSMTESNIGFFVGVPPGTYDLSASLDGYVCDKVWPGVGAAPVSAEVRPGWSTWVIIDCTPE